MRFFANQVREKDSWILGVKGSSDRERLGSDSVDTRILLSLFLDLFKNMFFIRRLPKEQGFPIK
jgi:hypothetical protein